MDIYMDIYMDICKDIVADISTLDHVVELANKSRFTFQIGADLHNDKDIQIWLYRISDAHKRFRESVFAKAIANAEIQKIDAAILASSICGTNAIEGGEFNEDEISAILVRSPAEIAIEAEQRVVNLKTA